MQIVEAKRGAQISLKVEAASNYAAPMTHERQNAVQVLFDQLENDELKAIFVSLSTVKPDKFKERNLSGLALVMSEIALRKMKNRGLA